MGHSRVHRVRSRCSTICVRPPSSRIDGSCPVAVSLTEQGPLRHRLLHTAGWSPTGDAVSGRRAAAGEPGRHAVGRPAERADDVLVSLRARRRSDLRARGGWRSREPIRHAVVQPRRLSRHPDWGHLADRARARREPAHAGDRERRRAHRAAKAVREPVRPVPRKRTVRERDIRPPDSLVTHHEAGEFEVRVKARNQVSRYIYSHHPFDVIGWDGHLWPFAFNIRGFRTDHRARASAAASTSDLRGPWLRGVLVRPAALRLPSAVDSRAV